MRRALLALVTVCACLTAAPAQATTVGVWTTASWLNTLDTTDAAYSSTSIAGAVSREATRLSNGNTGYTATIADMDTKNDTAALACAYRVVREGVADPADSGNRCSKSQIRDAISTITGQAGWTVDCTTTYNSTCMGTADDTYTDGSTNGYSRSILAIGRGLASYVIAADLIDLAAYDATIDGKFRTWMGNILTRVLPCVNSNGTSCTYPSWGDTVQERCDVDPNNWGQASCTAMTAYYRYTNDSSGLDKMLATYQSWVTGDTKTVGSQTHSGDSYWRWEVAGPDPDHISKWNCDPNGDGTVSHTEARGLNASTCTINGRDMSGGVPEELRRSTGVKDFFGVAHPECYDWCLIDADGDGASDDYPRQNYVYTSLDHLMTTVEILYKAGYSYSSTWGYDSSALMRAMAWLGIENVFYASDSGDGWLDHITDYRYDTAIVRQSPTPVGKTMGFTAWTHCATC